MLKDRYAFIWQDDFLSLLNDDEKALLKHKKAIKGEVIYAQKLKFIIFKSGRAHLKYYSEINEYILGLVRQKNLIVLDSSSGLEMIENSSFYELSFKTLLKFITNERFTNSVLNALVRNILSQRDMTYDYTFLSIEDRILKFLTHIYKVQKSTNGIVKVCAITTMSQLLGASRQNVSKVINQFIKQGLISKISRDSYDISALLKDENYAHLMLRWGGGNRILEFLKIKCNN